MKSEKIVNRRIFIKIQILALEENNFKIIMTNIK